MRPQSFAQIDIAAVKPQVAIHVEPALGVKVDQCIERTQKFLLGKQHEDGHWIGELFVDTTVSCDYLLYMYWKGEVDFTRQDKIVKSILRRQQADGGWNIYTGGPSEINATVKCYFALKLAGFTPDEPELRRARDVILRLGGIPKTNTYNKLFLALMGQFPWKYVPSIPSEVILLPNWFFFNIYELSSWTRAMLVPLAIINHFRPTRHLPPEKQLHELYPYGTEGADFSLPRSKKFFSLRNFFLGCDALLKALEKSTFKPFRSMALKKCEEWITERITHGSDGLGAIFPSMLNTMVAFKCLGYSDDHPLYAKAEQDFRDLEVDDFENDDFRIQPCLSPVWDTAITSVALAESGIPSDHPQLQKAADWLLSKEVLRRGDWAVKNPFPYASGWAFEFNNEYYPDADDTFKVLLALRMMKASDEKKQKEIMDRSLEWARSFQCKDGGFAAFDKDVTQAWLEDVPFADHKAILDPSCSDITGRGLECLGKMGFSKDEPRIQKMIQFLKKTQEEDGSWFGRWGVNYIYGTWQALRGLKHIGEAMNQDWILRARDWIESCQNSDGGWGETPASYDDPRLKGQGPSTPSQTAWAIMGLLEFNDLKRSSIQQGIHYLVTTQQNDGTWREDQITGTGFPSVFYLKYDMYRINWPLIVLAEYRAIAQPAALKPEMAMAMA
ncbi:MAG: squalene--hopene cyclase [Verrucomicrobiota bacterium]